MKNLSSNNAHPITVEAYVGWPTEEQADIIGKNLDRLLVHAYVSDPNLAFAYTKNRLIDFANANPGLDVSIIFSSESNFMQDWLINNNMTIAEDIFSTDWINESFVWDNNINLIGFTYFAYTFNNDVVLSTKNEKDHDRLTIYPNPVKNTLSVRNVDDLKNIRLYNSIGQLILETQEDKIDIVMLPKVIYILQINTGKGMETKKIIKD